MGSAKGPGLIGMLLALVVLVGFGTLYMLAFEEGSGGGGKSLAAIIRDNEESIVNYQSKITAEEETLASTTPRLKKTSDELRVFSAKAKLLSTTVSDLTDQASTLESDLVGLDDDFENYKNQYRAHVRNKAADTRIEELKTNDGTVYHSVIIRKVTAVGIEVRHRDGLKRIGFQELPTEMQDYYQFDKEQMLSELQRELKVRNKHDHAVAVANHAAGKVADKQRAQDDEEARQRRIKKVAVKELQLQAVASEMRQLESDISSAERAASAARSADRMHLNRAGSIRGALNSKRAEYSRLSAEIARLKASI